jgi:hypothetical protein
MQASTGILANTAFRLSNLLCRNTVLPPLRKRGIPAIQRTVKPQHSEITTLEHFPWHFCQSGRDPAMHKAAELANRITDIAVLRKTAKTENRNTDIAALRS